LDTDTFGNLDDWGKVLKTLEDLKKKKKLDKHQSGLARILRDGQNWRLLERVLEYGKEINQPADEFLAEVTDIMANRNIYLDARILAAEVLDSLVPRRSTNSRNDGIFSKTLLIRKMVDILNSSEPPIFHELIANSLEVIKGKRQVEIPKEL